MKTLLAVLGVLVLATQAFAQGTVYFDTQFVNARVYGFHDTFDPTGASTNSSIKGTDFWAQLYAAEGVGAAESSLVAVGSPVNMRGGINAGYVVISGPVNPVVEVPTTSGGPVTLQMRVWNSAYASYDAAVAAFFNGMGLTHDTYGKSALLSLASTGSNVSVPPTTPVSLVGLTSFQMVGVPEPGSVALVSLGALGLLAARKRK